MARPCFLCGTTVLPARQSRWALPGLGECDLGFGACSGCGLVLQTPAAPKDLLRRYYAEHAVYTSPGRQGEPHPRKRRGITRLLHMIEHALGRAPSSAFQVGCSDGYSLDRLRQAGTARVAGIDPSAASAQVARERYGIEYRIGSIEECAELDPAELWVLTHVLEHLVDPLQVLRRAREAQGPGGWIVVEVPLFEKPELFAPGYLSFEHVNYFDEASLTRMLELAGYQIVGIDKEFEDDIYPVVAAIARAAPANASACAEPLNAKIGLARLKQTLQQEVDHWKRTSKRLDTIEAGRKIFIWGAGIHTSQLLAFTDIARRFELQGIFDSSSSRWGIKLGEYACLNPNNFAIQSGDCVVISSYASEAEIFAALGEWREAGVEVVRLYAD